MSEMSKGPDYRKFRPSEFMRARRPHLFSDSEVTEQAQLDPSTLEYHLETLTSRKQELDFEGFARKLAEKEICPNILPQTGPTGGGDSKVDSETYPVSPEISDRLYYADPKGRDAANERWAFAFSAKEDWRAKASSDVKAIAGTGRGYTKAFFITSRFAKDKARAALEDKLSKEYGLDVRILDRTWIVKKVFENGRERLAIECLKCTVPLVPAPKKGPRDLSREAELKELEEQITDPSRYVGLSYQLTEDALQAALLARGIELPRVEVEAKFERAVHLAQKQGTNQQQLCCAYNKAWTYFWWYEDFPSFIGAYDTVEALARESSQVSDIELLQNLWQLLYATAKTGTGGLVDARTNERTATLRSALQAILADTTRPNASLRARAGLLLMDLSFAYDNSGKLKEVFRAFRGVFEKSKGLIDFPAKHFVKLLMELSDLLPDDEEFDVTFESALAVARERESQTVSGRMLLRRGRKKLESGKPYEAIRLLGRAQQDLALQEARGEMVMALGLCGAAYEAAGLLWAARGSLLVAVNQSLKEFWEEGKIVRPALICLRKLIWLELQLGRVPYVLAWAETFLIMNSAVEHELEAQRQLAEEWTNLDGILGLLLLRTDLRDLRDLGFLPPVLEKFHLDGSWMALLYALGYEDKLRTEEVIPVDESPGSVAAFFEKWLSQPAGNDLPSVPELIDRSTVELRSTVLGCEIIATASNNNESLFLAEGILAGVESFLATSLDFALLPHASRIHLRVNPSDFLDQVLEFTVKSAPHTIIDVQHRKDCLVAAEVTGDFKDKLVEVISHVAAYLATPAGPGLEQLESLIRDERALGRAILITGIRTLVANILGENPKIRISDWTSTGDQGESYPLLRTEPWNHGRLPGHSDVERVAPSPGVGEPPAELFDVERLKHRDRRVFSLINFDLWDKAGWAGTGFIMPADPCLDEPPYLTLIFENLQAAETIFQGWLEKVGPEDSKERIRVSIVTGISTENPAAYRVILGTNPDWSTMPSTSQFVLVYRINTMHPITSANLDRFLERYSDKKKYMLVPGEAQGAGLGRIAPKLGILKRELVVRPAWQIGEHDPDICGINLDDKIIIPDGVKDAPVLAAMARKKKRVEAEPNPFRMGGTTLEPNHKMGRNEPCYCGSGKKYKKCHGR